MNRAKRQNLGVDWYVPHRKTRIATSTVATRDLIELLSGDGKTIRQVWREINYDPEARDILAIYIEQGYGHNSMCDPPVDWTRETRSI